MGSVADCILCEDDKKPDTNTKQICMQNDEEIPHLQIEKAASISHVDSLNMVYCPISQDTLCTTISIMMDAEIVESLLNIDDIPVGSPENTECVSDYTKEISQEKIQNFLETQEKANLITPQTEDLELCEIEKDVTSFRVKRLADIMDVNELQDIINKEYSLMSDASSISDSEKEEIQRRKSECETHPKSSNARALYRENTKNNWDDSEIDTLRFDMSKRLLTLTKHENNKITNSDIISLKPTNKGNTILNNDKHLFRYRSSRKWDLDEIENTKDEMQKEIMSLILMQQQIN
eukprot:84352_1